MINVAIEMTFAVLMSINKVMIQLASVDHKITNCRITVCLSDIPDFMRTNCHNL